MANMIAKLVHHGLLVDNYIELAGGVYTLVTCWGPPCRFLAFGDSNTLRSHGPCIDDL